MKMFLNKTIADIKKDFNNFFPGLSLSFYTTPHEKGAVSSPKEEINELVALEGIIDFSGGEYIEIDPEMSVTNLESSMQEKYNLSVQVFRKSNDVWLQTSSTDHWSLKHQNEKALESELQNK